MEETLKKQAVPGDGAFSHPLVTPASVEASSIKHIMCDEKGAL
jgi:hypothetical protein